MHEALGAAEACRRRGLTVGVVDMPSIDEDLLLALAESGKLVCLAEQNSPQAAEGDYSEALKLKLDPGTTHGAPYDYDTHVPLLVYGPGIRGGVREEPTTPQAIASIFAKWLNVRRPKDAAFPIPETLE